VTRTRARSFAPEPGLTLGSTVILNNGVAMPRLGLGVYQTGPGRETRTAVLAALELGYRLVDTAAVYGNERDVGAALRESGVPREQVFVTTKLWNSDHGYQRTLRAFDSSLRALGLDVLDLYLLHWPVPNVRLQSWLALERLLLEGRARAIGVSNFTIPHLSELLDAGDVAPAVNQIELHPFLPQIELVAFCHGRGVQVEAYSPLARGERMDHPALQRIARGHRKSPAQVMIRWSLQRGLVTIPKSARRERIAENADVFDFTLEPAEMKDLDGLNEELHTDWDPTEVR
jgi:diketogulonate reductase-like aldo/keto reductase